MRTLLARPGAAGAVQDRLEHAVLDMTQVVERTVQTGQLDRGALPVRPAPTDLSALLQRALAGLPDTRRVHLPMAPGEADSAPTVMTDHFLPEVVVRNLLDNALKYSPPDSEVEARLTLPYAQGRWTLVVSNRPVEPAGPTARGCSISTIAALVPATAAARAWGCTWCAG